MMRHPCRNRRPDILVDDFGSMSGGAARPRSARSTWKSGRCGFERSRLARARFETGWPRADDLKLEWIHRTVSRLLHLKCDKRGEIGSLPESGGEVHLREHVQWEYV